MVHVILCMHTQLLEALCELSEELTKEPLKASCVPFELAAPERELYERLAEEISPLPPERPVLIIGDLLGSPSATVSMSIPHPHISFIGGASAPLLMELNPALEWLESLELSPLEQLAALTERLCVVGRAHVVDSQSYLRPEGEDSQIDSSYYEGSVFGLGLSASSLSEQGS